jgi:peptidoglycan-N-acetylglucosamine deacetylase
MAKKLISFYNQYPVYLLFTLVPFVSCEVKEKKLIPETKNDTNNRKSILQKKIKDTLEFKIVSIKPTTKKVSTAIEYDTSKKYIYLTFDDGPQHGTVACFDLCKKLQVKSTFFMVGLHASSENLRNIVREIDNAYPQTLLANHSSSHAKNKYQSFYLHDSAAVEDLLLAQKVLKVPFKIVRLPGSNSWLIKDRNRPEPLAKNVCKRMDTTGFNIIGWDMEWNFSPITANPVQSADEMIDRVKLKLEHNHLYTNKHLVILMHDRMFRNSNYADSLNKFISTLQKDSNYVFETVDHYPGLKPLKN